MKGGYQNREECMSDDELRDAYIKIMIKYQLDGIDLPKPSELNFFTKQNEIDEQNRLRSLVRLPA